MIQSLLTIYRLRHRRKFFTRWPLHFLKYIFFGIFQKRILILNYTGFENHLGCLATSHKLLELIQKNKSQAILPLPIKYPMSGLNSFPSLQEIQEKKVPKYLSNHLFMKFLFWTCHEVIVNGEGTLWEYSTWKHLSIPYNLLLDIYVAKYVYNKKVHIVNHSAFFEASKTPSAFKQLLHKVYLGCDSIAARELRSFNRLKTLNVPNLSHSSDCAFLLQPQKKLSKNHVYLKRYPYLNSDFIALFLNAEFENLLPSKSLKIIQLCEKIKHKFNLNIIFFPFTKGEALHVQEYERHGLQTAYIDDSYHTLIEVLSSAKVILSGRFHCCIFSILAGTPFLPFKSNTDKVEGLVEMLDYSLPVLDYNKLDESNVIDAIGHLLENRQALQEKLITQIPRLKQMGQLNV